LYFSEVPKIEMTNVVL